MIKGLIIEDEKPTARRLKRLLEKNEVEVVEMLNSVHDAKEWLSTHPNPDLIFMDIHLADGLGFEIIDDTIKHIPIIFTTAYDQYALKAFKLNSIDYLLKPLKEEELVQALNKFKDSHPPVDWKKFFQTYSDLITEQKAYKERFVVKKGNFIHIIPVEEISCFLSEDKITKLINKKRQYFYLDESLDKIEKQLNPDYFFRINRKYIISISDIKEMIKYSNSRIKIVLNSHENMDLIIARERVNKFLSIINK